MPLKYWVLKGRPNENRWDEMLRPGAKQVWHTKRPPSSWQPGDRLFCWSSSPILSIVGLAELSKPRLRVDKAGETLFQVTYRSHPLNSRLTIGELRKTPVIREASFLKSGPATTVHSLSTEQAEVLLGLIYSRNPGLDKAWDDIELSPREAIIPDFEQVTALEGNEKLVSHFVRERDGRLIQMKKQAALESFGRLACEVCSFDFGVSYGARGLGFCEVHHLSPLAEVDSETPTRLADLAIVCSNCHRMLHRGELMTLEQLREALKISTSGVLPTGAPVAK